MEKEEEWSSGKKLAWSRVLLQLVVINKIDPSLRNFIAASRPPSSRRLSRDPRISPLLQAVERSMGRCSNEGEYRAARAESETTLIPRVLNSYINSEGNRAGGSRLVSRAIETVPCQRPLFFFFLLFSISSASRKRCWVERVSFKVRRSEKRFRFGCSNQDGKSEGTPSGG